MRPMGVRDRTREARRNAVSLAIVMAGTLCAAVIYLTASLPSQSPLGNPEDSKTYLREMEVIGGKSNLLAYEVREWFVSLWHGKRLALTVLVLALIAALVHRIWTTPIPPTSGASGRDGK